MKVLQILLVEDDVVDVMTVRRACEKNKLKHEIAVAENGFEALKMLRGIDTPSIHPSVILLDLNMPKMNGLEFLTEIRKDNQLKFLPVFVFTSSTKDEDKIEAYNLNVAGYILKPNEFEQFEKNIGILSEYWNIIEYSNN